MSRGKMTSLKI